MFVQFTAFFHLFLREFDQVFIAFRIGLFDNLEARFVRHIVSHGFRRCLGIQLQPRFAFTHAARVKTVQRPEARFNSRFLVIQALFADFKALGDTMRVRDNQGRSVEGFGFNHRFDDLRVVRAQSNLSDIDVFGRHGNHAQVFAGQRLTGNREFGGRANRGRFGLLTARVGINAGIHDQNVDILARIQDVVQTAVADIVSPAVAAQRPNGFFNKVIRQAVQRFRRFRIHRSQFGFQRFDADALFLDFGVVRLRRGQNRVGQIAADFAFQVFNQLVSVVFLEVDGQTHTQTEFRGVFEQRVRPSRTAAVRVFRVRSGRQVAAVNGRTARCVGNHQTIAEQLCQQFDIRRFTAPGARTGKFKQRTQQLNVFDQFLFNLGPIDVRQRHKEVEILLFLFQMRRDRFHIDCFFGRIFFVFRRTSARAQRAARAVFRSDLNDPSGIGKVLAFERGGFKAGRSLLQIFVRRDFGADCRVRANHGALAALDTGFGIPNGDVGSDAAFFVLRRRRRPRAVSRPSEIGHFQFFALAFQNLAGDFLHDFGSRFGNARQTFEFGRRFVGDFNFVQVSQRRIYGGEVLVDQRLTFFHIGLFNGFLNRLDGFVAGQNARQREVAGLHNRIDAATHARLFGDFDSVDRIQFQVLLDNFFLNFDRQVVPNFFRFERSVQQKHGAVFRLRQHVDFFQEREVVARNKVRFVNQIRSIDDVVRETQVRRGHRARFFRVVHKVGLTVNTVFARDDFNRVFVRADRSISTQAEENGAFDVFVFDIERIVDVQRQVCHVVRQTDRKAGLGFGFFSVFKHGFRHGGGVFFGRQTVAAADNARHRFQLARRKSVGNGGNDIQEQRFALRACFLRAVHDGNRFDRRGQSFNQFFRRERTIQVNLEDTVFFVFQMSNRGFGRIGARTHDDNNLFGVFCTDVIDQVILTTRDFGVFVHRFLNDRAAFFIIRVGGFANLEEHVGILRRSAQDGVIRRQSVFAVEVHRQTVDEFAQLIVGNDFDFVDFVRRAETVKEVHERNTGFHRGVLSNRRHILRFLNVVGAQHRKARLTASHHVGVIAENRQSVRSDGARGDVHNERSQFARDFVQVRNHQQQALRRRESRRQSPRLQRTVNRADSAGFGLHFIDFGNFSPNVLDALSRPRVRPFAHRGRRGNRVDNGDFVQTMRNTRRGFVCVHHLHFLVFIRHGFTLQEIRKNNVFREEFFRKRQPIRRFESFSRPHAGYCTPQRKRLQHFFNEMSNDLA